MLLSVTNLTISFTDTHQKKHAVVHDISFELKNGESIGLVGESGSGKSVTAHAIMRLLPSTAHFSSKSRILLNGLDTLSASPKDLQRMRGKKVGYIFQEPMSALNPLHTIGDQVAETILQHENITHKEAKKRVHKLFEQVQLHNFEKRYGAYPHQLSGGQRQRVMIAMAIACKPELLIADEPTTALDVTVQAEIINLLKTLIKEQNMALLLISHNLSIVQKIATRVIIMQNGHFIEQGECKKIFTSPQHAYTKALLAKLPANGPRPIDNEAKTVLKAENLMVNFSSKPLWFWQKPKQFCALKEFNCTLKQGETLGIVGESGSGKTTAALAMLNLLPHEGKTLFNKVCIEDMSKPDARNLRKVAQIIFQDPFGSLNPRFSVEQIISEGLKVHEAELTPTQRLKKIKKALKDVFLPESFCFRYPHELSGGQRQRIAIARSLVLGPDILILDEPTSALDHSTQTEILTLLTTLQEKHHLSFIIISHDLAVIRALSHRILILKDGKIVEEGTNKDILTHPQKSYTQQLIQSTLNL